MNSYLYTVLVPALLPVVLIIFYICKKDTVEKEPIGFVFKVMLFGAIFAIPCAFIERGILFVFTKFIEEGTIKYAVWENFVGVALVEEVCKWIVIQKIVWKNKNFDYQYDGIVYGAASSLGFAALENILYIISFGTDISFARGIYSIPGHATFGVFMGLYFTRAKIAFCNGNIFKSKRLKLKALLIPTVIHGMYDFLLDDIVQEKYFTPFTLFVIILDIVALRIIRREHKHDEPFEINYADENINTDFEGDFRT